MFKKKKILRVIYFTFTHHFQGKHFRLHITKKRIHCIQAPGGALISKMEAIAQNRKEQESKHFTSLQIFTSHAEPSLEEYLPRKDQQLLEQKQRDEEDKLYR